jgi:hypothetical protein
MSQENVEIVRPDVAAVREAIRQASNPPTDPSAMDGLGRLTG